MLPNVGAALERLTAFFQASDMPRRVAPGKPWPCSDKPRSEEPRPQGHGEGAAVAEQGQGAAVAEPQQAPSVDIDTAGFVFDVDSDDLQEKLRKEARPFYPDNDDLLWTLRCEEMSRHGVAWESHGSSSSGGVLPPPAGAGHLPRAPVSDFAAAAQPAVAANSQFEELGDALALLGPSEHEVPDTAGDPKKPYFGQWALAASDTGSSTSVGGADRPARQPPMAAEGADEPVRLAPMGPDHHPVPRAAAGPPAAVAEGLGELSDGLPLDATLPRGELELCPADNLMAVEMAEMAESSDNARPQLNQPKAAPITDTPQLNQPKAAPITDTRPRSRIYLERVKHNPSGSINKDRMVGNTSYFFLNNGTRPTDDNLEKDDKKRKVHHNADQNIRKCPAWVLCAAECNKTIRNLLEQDENTGDEAYGVEPQSRNDPHHKMERRPTSQYRCILQKAAADENAKNGDTGLLIAVRSANSEGLELLEEKTFEDHSKVLCGKVTYKDTCAPGFTQGSEVIMVLHLNAVSAKAKKGECSLTPLTEFLNLVISWIRKYGVDKVLGDLNMFLFQFPIALRSCGLDADVLAWYPWRVQGTGKLAADSCGIFQIRQHGAVVSQLEFGAELIGAMARMEKGDCWYEDFSAGLSEKAATALKGIASYEPGPQQKPGHEWDKYYEFHFFQKKGGDGISVARKDGDKKTIRSLLEPFLKPTTSDIRHPEAAVAGRKTPFTALVSAVSAETRDVIRFKQKAHATLRDCWMCDGEYIQGAHYPLLVFSKNVGGRSAEAWKRRSEKKRQKLEVDKPKPAEVTPAEVPIAGDSAVEGCERGNWECPNASQKRSGAPAAWHSSGRRMQPRPPQPRAVQLPPWEEKGSWQQWGSEAKAHHEEVDDHFASGNHFDTNYPAAFGSGKQVRVDNRSGGWYETEPTSSWSSRSGGWNQSAANPAWVGAWNPWPGSEHEDQETDRRPLRMELNADWDQNYPPRYEGRWSD